MKRLILCALLCCSPEPPTVFHNYPPTDSEVPPPVCGASCPQGTSWTTDIEPVITNNCTGCHASGQPPMISGEAVADYRSLTNFVYESAMNPSMKPYIAGCSAEPLSSSFAACNLNGPSGALEGQPACGDAMPLGGSLSAAEIATITQWLECGAPLN